MGFGKVADEAPRAVQSHQALDVASLLTTTGDVGAALTVLLEQLQDRQGLGTKSGFCDGLRFRFSPSMHSLSRSRACTIPDVVQIVTADQNAAVRVPSRCAGW